MTIKRFLKLQIIFIMLIIITISANVSAWAPRPAVRGGSFMSEGGTDSGTTAISKDHTYFTAMQLITPAKNYFVNGYSCTAKTYTGTYNESNGNIIYGDDESIKDSPITNLIATGVAKDNAYYFKTVISNPTNVATNVSLFINIKYDQNFGTSLIYNTSSPVIREEIFHTSGSADAQGYLHLDMLSLVRNYEIPANGTVNVEWSIINVKDYTGKFEISDIILTNN